MRIVVPFGFYGYGNIGDEATLHGFARLLKLTRYGNEARVAVGSRDPVHTARVEPSFQYFRPGGVDVRRYWAKFRAAAHVFAGGTPVSDVLGDWPLSEVVPLARAAERRMARLSFVGVGVEDLTRRTSIDLLRDEIGPRVRHWTVRSSRDRGRLIDYGISPERVTVGADMAWLIEPSTREFGRQQLRAWGIDPERPLIGVNLVNENHVFDRDPAMPKILAAALDEWVRQLDGHVVFLANEVRPDPTFDVAANERVMAQMARRDRATLPPPRYFAPREMLSIVACCAFTMSMRYHFCLFSALQAVPFVAIQRSSKVADLAWELQWTAAVERGALDLNELIAHGSTVIERGSALAAHLRQRSKAMSTRARDNAVALDALAM